MHDRTSRRPDRRPVRGTPRSRPAALAGLQLGGWTGLVARALPIVAAWVVFRGAFRFGFAQDDWIRLESALEPFTSTLSDLVSRGTAGRRPIEQLYFAGAVRLFGPSATAFHALAALMHGVNVFLVHHLALRVTSPPVALIGAIFFAVHCAAFTVVYWTACAPELLCALFSLVCLALVITPNRSWRWSIPLYLAALGAKETALLLPAVAAALAWVVGERGVPGRRRALVLAAVAGLWFGLFYVFWKEGLLVQAYALDPDVAGMAGRAATYLAWAFGFAGRIGFVEQASGLEQGLAIAGALALGAVALRRGGRERRVASLGLVWFAAFIIPAVVIAGHLHRYLLYLAVPGLVFLAAPGLELGTVQLSRSSGARAARGVRVAFRRHLPAIAIAAAIVAIIGAAHVATVRTEGYAVMVDGIWNRHHFVVRRADIAGRVLAQAASDVRALGPDATVIFVGSDGKRDWWDTNVRAAIADGAALRVMFGRPDLEVRFFERGDPPPPALAAGRTLVFLYDPYGRLWKVTDGWPRPAAGVAKDGR